MQDFTIQQTGQDQPRFTNQDMLILPNSRDTLQATSPLRDLKGQLEEGEDKLTNQILNSFNKQQSTMLLWSPITLALGRKIKPWIKEMEGSMSNNMEDNIRQEETL